MRLLDLFCGRWGWSRAFAARGWECVGVDLVEPPEVPKNCSFIQADILTGKVDCYHKTIWLAHAEWTIWPDFIVASPPCQEFSKHGLRCFYPDPPYPELGVKLFNHTQALCRESGIPYVIENVRSAVDFVGNAVHNCGPFYLWGNAVPTLLPPPILKGRRLTTGGYKRQTGSASDGEASAKVATIPPALANCVVDYAERILEARTTVADGR